MESSSKLTLMCIFSTAPDVLDASLNIIVILFTCLLVDEGELTLPSVLERSFLSGEEVGPDVVCGAEDAFGGVDGLCADEDAAEPILSFCLILNSFDEIDSQSSPYLNVDIGKRKYGNGTRYCAKKVCRHRNLL